ncbi:hypothetical protein TWF718_000590 [Orbilia javanica]|uniref:Uncharacterized protein n=1 Tax=Orbilia javanica TaxID=47235 RepID=A0AAN8RMD4_9PEZI
MCLPRFSIVEEYDDDASYTNSRPTVHRHSATRNSAYIPRSSLRSFRSKHSHSSGSEGVYYDQEGGQFVPRRMGHHSLSIHRSGSRPILVDTSSTKRSGNVSTSIEINDERSGTTTTIISGNGRRPIGERKTVGFDKYKYEKTPAMLGSDLDIPLDDDRASSGSSTESGDFHRPHRGRSHHRSSSRGRSHSGSRSRAASHSRSRSRSVDSYRRDYFTPQYQHAGHEYPQYQQQQSVPVTMAASGQMVQTYPQTMNTFIQPQGPIGAGLVTTQPQQIIMQPMPQLLAQDPMHGIHGQYYQGRQAGPVIPQTMVPLQLTGSYPLIEPQVDQG